MCGIALLSLLVDVVLPDGNTKKYVRTVVGVVLSFLMLSPITTFFDELSLSNAYADAQMEIQQQYIDGLTQQQDLARLQRVSGVLEQMGLPNCSVSLESNGYVCASVRCDRQMLAKVQEALSAVEKQIMVRWSESGG